MLIEVWSDVVCPWCFIGKRRLESALEQAGVKDAEIVVTMLPAGKHVRDVYEGTVLAAASKGALLIEMFMADNTAWSKKLNRVVMMREAPALRSRGMAARLTR